MAKLERTLTGDFNQWLDRITNGILNGSVTATLEDRSISKKGKHAALCVYLKDTAMLGTIA